MPSAQYGPSTIEEKKTKEILSHNPVKLKPSRVASLRYDDKTLNEDIITKVCQLYALGNMRLSGIVKHINSTLIRCDYPNIRPLTLPDIYAILYQEKMHPKYTTGRFSILTTSFTNELSVLQFITFLASWSQGCKFETCYNEMMNKITSRNNPSKGFCHNTFKALQRLYSTHKNQNGRRIRNRAYKTLFNDVFRCMRLIKINEYPALTILFKDIPTDAVYDIIKHIPGFGKIMKDYIEGNFDIDTEVNSEQIELGKTIEDSIKKEAKNLSVQEDVILNRFHGEENSEEDDNSSRRFDPDNETGLVNNRKKINDNIITGTQEEQETTEQEIDILKDILYEEDIEEKDSDDSGELESGERE